MLPGLEPQRPARNSIDNMGFPQNMLLRPATPYIAWMHVDFVFVFRACPVEFNLFS